MIYELLDSTKVSISERRVKVHEPVFITNKADANIVIALATWYSRYKPIDGKRQNHATLFSTINNLMADNNVPRTLDGYPYVTRELQEFKFTKPYQYVVCANCSTYHYCSFCINDFLIPMCANCSDTLSKDAVYYNPFSSRVIGYTSKEVAILQAVLKERYLASTGKNN